MNERKNFKVTVGGFNKKEVLDYLNQLSESAKASEKKYKSLVSNVRQENTRLTLRISELEKSISPLNERLNDEQNRSNALEQHNDMLIKDIEHYKSAFYNKTQEVEELIRALEMKIDENRMLTVRARELEKKSERFDELRQQIAELIFETKKKTDIFDPGEHGHNGWERNAYGYTPNSKKLEFHNDLNAFRKSLNELEGQIAGSLADISAFINSAHLEVNNLADSAEPADSEPEFDAGVFEVPIQSTNSAPDMLYPSYVIADDQGVYGEHTHQDSEEPAQNTYAAEDYGDSLKFDVQQEADTQVPLVGNMDAEGKVSFVAAPGQIVEDTSEYDKNAAEYENLPPAEPQEIYPDYVATELTNTPEITAKNDWYAHGFLDGRALNTAKNKAGPLPSQEYHAVVAEPPVEAAASAPQCDEVQAGSFKKSEGPEIPVLNSQGDTALPQEAAQLSPVEHMQVPSINLDEQLPEEQKTPQQLFAEHELQSAQKNKWAVSAFDESGSDTNISPKASVTDNHAAKSTLKKAPSSLSDSSYVIPKMSTPVTQAKKTKKSEKQAVPKKRYWGSFSLKKPMGFTNDEKLDGLDDEEDFLEESLLTDPLFSTPIWAEDRQESSSDFHKKFSDYRRTGKN